MSNGNAGEGVGNAIKGAFNTAHGLGETIRGTVNGNLDKFGEGITNNEAGGRGGTANSTTNLEGSGATAADHQSTAQKGLDEIKQGISSVQGAGHGGSTTGTGTGTGTANTTTQ
ncbi:hypothetical protein FA10DRAFT_266256 [Acaromyces ingoldii]|uniref:Uncharacterized protein n=1 Tax=Acaromyces ingoldii TaxID=215250 RepID=A0A316YSX0_9BASI|nr:hypothetical protein FA10DRAFT_266256 [Acaromyces ingoldii]PWN92507.1 hypothetical protein FA10DRAFT_266256 [Acaromyces ingoldii]